ncbi:MAG: bifunctional demethylmenaquinone methyltransferase/2-methoxy-6-polyprenyl,4-benzoquinol methylase [Bacteroidota bacterium]|jgi:demethylmenaquinone methyltransferase/2-methoxy-6-polyprenyl-1,4-benzoquinol methylase|nr:bifunctional demethylmenaquinone methyltransferase/2-methoxy-6-polyprenyl-1,4-benzoquinol methylase UbiE [Bacteroidota bacterium]
MSTVKPYNQTGKKEEVEQMFDQIAHSYDFLNHFFSLGIDIIWRKRAIKELKKYAPKKVLDVATGTADFAIQSVKSNLQADEIIGVDISEGMLEVGRKKIKEKGIDHIIQLRRGDSEQLPFEEKTFDAYTVAFGVRNFENLELGMSDMLRVLKTGGVGVVLEFSKPTVFPIKQLFRFYFRFIMPTVGKWISKDSRAYTYLPESVDAFPSGNAFLEVMKKVGYSNTRMIRLAGGIATIYIGEK